MSEEQQKAEQATADLRSIEAAIGVLQKRMTASDARAGDLERLMTECRRELSALRHEAVGICEAIERLEKAK